MSIKNKIKFVLLSTVFATQFCHADNYCATLKPYVDKYLKTSGHSPHPLIFTGNKNSRPAEGQVVGAIFGIYKDGHTCYFSYGRENLDSKKKPNQFTLFEMGSITKTFTAILIAQAAASHHFALSAPIINYLPPNIGYHLTPAESKVTFLNLLTHSAGFPNDPPGLYDNYPSSIQNYLEGRFVAFVSGIEPPHGKLPAPYSYSNAGFAFLGQIALGLNGYEFDQYGELVSKNITNPLHMRHTTTDVKPDATHPLAVGYSNCVGTKGCNNRLTHVAPWPYGTPMDGGGALRTNAADMMTFVKTLLGDNHAAPKELQQAIRNTLASAKPTVPIIGWNDHVQALAWEVQLPHKNTDLQYTKNGGTMGYTSIIVLDPNKKLGLVMLTNTNNIIDGTFYGNESYDLGLNIVNAIPK